MASQVIMLEMYCLESVFMGIIFTNKYVPLWWEKKYLWILKETTIQGQLQFKHVALFLAMYRKLVHWLQVSTKTRDGWLTFVWHAVHNTNASHMLMCAYTTVHGESIATPRCGCSVPYPYARSCY